MFNDARVWLSPSVENSKQLSKEVKRHGKFWLLVHIGRTGL